MEHDARSVANEIIRRAHNASQSITHLQVMKMVYFSHAWMLGLRHEPLIRQPVVAWRYGPVVLDIYDSLKKFGGEPINRQIPGYEESYDSSETNLIDQVWEIYGNGRFTGGQLSTMTHDKGTPWDQTMRKNGQNAVIPDPIIEDYYAAQAKAARD